MNHRNGAKKVCQHGVRIHGMPLPVNAVYGYYNNRAWACTDPNFYPDGRTLDVWIYDRKKEKWTMRPVSKGSIYEMLLACIRSNHLEGRRVVYTAYVRGTFQSFCPTGRRQKASGLRAAGR